jgi:hypothetical protein
MLFMLDDGSFEFNRFNMKNETNFISKCELANKFGASFNDVF